MVNDMVNDIVKDIVNDIVDNIVNDMVNNIVNNIVNDMVYNIVNNIVNNIVKDMVNLTSCKSSTWSATVLNCSDKDFSSSSFSASPSWISFSVYYSCMFFFLFSCFEDPGQFKQ